MHNPYQSPAPLEPALAEPAEMVSPAEVKRVVQIFRGLLFLYAALTVTSLFAGFALRAYLPADLQAYVESSDEMSFQSAGLGLAAVGLGLAALMVLIVSWFGLLFFWRPARWLFLGSEVLILPLMVLLGPSVMHGAEYALESASHLTSGAIMAMAFFSPVKTRFAKSTKPDLR